MIFRRQLIDDAKERKVCAIDLDGVISNYPKCWVDFINSSKAGKKFKDLNEAKNALTYNEYRFLKKRYRTEGVKRSLPVIKGAVEFIHILQKNGFNIVFMSSRPKEEYSQIELDTHLWLKEIGIKDYDLIWEKHKHWKVLQEYPFLKFFVEDNSEIANNISSVGYRVYVLGNQYNKQELGKNCFRVKSFDEILRNEVV